MKYLILIIAIVFIGGYLYLKQPALRNPIVKPQTESDHYTNGYFKNVIDRPVLNSGDSFFTSLYKFLFSQDDAVRPEHIIPSHKTDLTQLDKQKNVLIWMGHSSYFMQLEGKTYLVDPVFSTNASPVPQTNVAFDGSNIYSQADMPQIDYLLITHDHWDHLDYPTIIGLKDKVKQVITPLGVDSYLTQWGYEQDKVFAGDWGDKFEQDSINIHILPAQHFSGRLLERNKTLWASYAIRTDKHKLYFSGDTGYGPHFKQIAEQFGGFDLAILEDGQYNKDWAHIHMTPEQTVQAALDLNANTLLPAHNSKFKLSRHAWYEPLERTYQASQDKPYRLLTPLIGDAINLDDNQQNFPIWWR